MADRNSMVVIFGGSFDPIHRGHLLAAEEARQQLQVDRVWLLPCHIPPHKAKLQATPAQRLDMLQLALLDFPHLKVDTWELEQQQPSYTLTTLRRYRQQYGEATSLVFLMGWDSLQKLPSWFQWRELESLTNFAVWPRPGYQALPAEVANWLETRKVAPEQLMQHRCGAVALLATTPVDISSTQLRDQSAHMQLPTAVQAYISQHGLYSST